MTTLNATVQTPPKSPASIWKLALKGLGLLPQNLLSFATGWVVRLQWPAPLQTVLNKVFVHFFKINMQEASGSLKSYSSIEEVFTRALAPGARSVVGPYASSADGVLECSKPVQYSDQAVQAKGLTYSLSQLVTGHHRPPIAAAWYTTVYLAPHNYHRVHAPCTGVLTGLHYIPGRLWPVNRPAVSLVPQLFVQNERLVFEFLLDNGGLTWVVMVGAFNVGRMSTPFCKEFTTNQARQALMRSHPSSRLNIPPRSAVNVGDEIGTFMLGSTTVVVLDQTSMQFLKPRLIDTSCPVQVGQSLSL